MDTLDLALLTMLREHPRAGALELSRLTKVARATVQARLQRMEDSGVITGYGPDIDVVAAGYPVRAFVSLKIAQGDLPTMAADLEAMPGVLEAYVTTGSEDILCLLAGTSHEDLQSMLLRLNASPTVVRSTSVIILSVVVSHRVMPLLSTGPSAVTSPRAPAYRNGSG